MKINSKLLTVIKTKKLTQVCFNSFSNQILKNEDTLLLYLHTSIKSLIGTAVVTSSTDHNEHNSHILQVHKRERTISNAIDYKYLYL